MKESLSSLCFLFFLGCTFTVPGVHRNFTVCKSFSLSLPILTARYNYVYFVLSTPKIEALKLGYGVRMLLSSTAQHSTAQHSHKHRYTIENKTPRNIVNCQVLTGWDQIAFSGLHEFPTSMSTFFFPSFMSCNLMVGAASSPKLFPLWSFSWGWSTVKHSQMQFFALGHGQRPSIVLVSGNTKMAENKMAGVLATLAAKYRNCTDLWLEVKNSISHAVELKRPEDHAGICGRKLR